MKRSQNILPVKLLLLNLVLPSFIVLCLVEVGHFSQVLKISMQFFLPCNMEGLTIVVLNNDDNVNTVNEIVSQHCPFLKTA